MGKARATSRNILEHPRVEKNKRSQSWSDIQRWPPGQVGEAWQGGRQGLTFQALRELENGSSLSNKSNCFFTATEIKLFNCI